MAAAHLFKSDFKMSRDNPESFAFYESFYEAIAALPTAKMQNELFHAVCEYGLYGKKPKSISKTANAMFIGFAYQIDSAKSKRKTKKSNGDKGGRPKHSVSDTKPKNNSVLDQKPKNISVSDTKPKNISVSREKPKSPNGNDNGKVNDKENGNIFLGRAEREKNKKPYGEFSNVFLTSTEYSNLPYQLGTDWKQQLEKLSAYKKSHPAFVSADDYATLKLWKTNETMKHGSKSREPPDPDTIAREKMLDDSLNEDMEAIWRDVEARERKEKGETNAKKA